MIKKTKKRLVGLTAVAVSAALMLALTTSASAASLPVWQTQGRAVQTYSQGANAAAVPKALDLSGSPGIRPILNDSAAAGQTASYPNTKNVAETAATASGNVITGWMNGFAAALKNYWNAISNSFSGKALNMQSLKDLMAKFFPNGMGDSQSSTPSAPAASPAPTAPPVQPAPATKPTAAPAPATKPTAAPAPTTKPTAAPAPTGKPAAAPAPTGKPAAAPAPTVKPAAVPAPTGKPAAAPAPTTAPDNLSAMESQMVQLVNSERAKAGVPALKVNAKLANMARVKAQDMEENGYFSHTSPTYGNPFDMMKTFGISFRTGGENIAMNQSVASAHTAFMNSQGHRANILNPAYTQIGIGIVSDGRGNLYFAQEFIG